MSTTLFSAFDDGDYLDGMTTMGITLTPQQARYVGEQLIAAARAARPHG